MTEPTPFYPAICTKHCSVCEGQDHHWMLDCDEETGDPLAVCKHCPARREPVDSDFDSYDGDEPAPPAGEKR